jgi:hypothetical protein
MRHLITLAFLIGAVALYVLGAGLSAMVLLALGVVAELVFWFRVFRIFRRRRNS